MWRVSGMFLLICNLYLYGDNFFFKYQMVTGSQKMAGGEGGYGTCTSNNGELLYLVEVIIDLCSPSRYLMVHWVENGSVVLKLIFLPFPSFP